MDQKTQKINPEVESLTMMTKKMAKCLDEDQRKSLKDENSGVIDVRKHI